MIQSGKRSEKMDEQWEVVFSSSKLYQAEIMKSVLEDENISSVIVNKQDSAYIVIGEIELYVKKEDILKAKQIINRSQTLE
jgi:hypothetical protein